MTESWKLSDQDDERMVASLLRMAGPREEASADSTRRVRDAAHASWRRAVVARRRRMLWLTGCVAAAAAAILVFALQTRRDVLDPAGELMLSNGDLVRGDGSVAPPGMKLLPGEVLTTDASARAALRLAGGPTLRMDAGTRVVLKGPLSLELVRGTIYLESDGDTHARGRLEVETPAGIVRDVGTRFEVSTRDGETRVRVRQGSVSLDRARGTGPIQAGAELVMDAAGGVRTGTIPASDPSWSWILEVAPGFEMEGRSLGAFLDWVSSETGMAVVFEPASAGPRARGIVLHGSIGTLRPDLAIGVVLPTCGLGHRVDGDTLVVIPASQDSKQVALPAVGKRVQEKGAQP